MKQAIQVGQTDYTVMVFIPDPASTDGSGKTGLVAADLTVSYTRVETDNDVTITDATGSLSNLSALTDAHADWGLKEVSNTLAPGLYRLDLADAVFASGAWSAVVYVMITSSAAAASPMEFVLVTHNPFNLGTAQTGDNYVRIGAPAGASVSADIAAVKADSAAIKTKTDFLPSVTAGGVGGVFIAGSNAATTIASLTVTGLVAFSDGMTITAATTDRSGLVITGNGAGHGMSLVPGATGNGLRAIGGATSGDAVSLSGTAGNARAMMLQGQGSGAGFRSVGGASGTGMVLLGGSSSGNALTAQSQGGTSSGVVFAGTGSGAGFVINAGATGIGFDINGGATSGVGLAIDSTSGTAMTVTAGGGNGNGIAVTANGSGDAWSLTAGATGNAVQLTSSGGVAIDSNGLDVVGLWQDLPTNAELSIALGTADDATLAAISALDGKVDIIDTNVDAILVDTGTTLDDKLDALQVSVADLPTNAELATALGTADDAVLAAIAALPSFDPTTEEVETGFTWTESARLWNAAMGGKASGLETTNALYRDLADSKNRIDATVDVDGNRTAVTLDLT